RPRGAFILLSTKPFIVATRGRLVRFVVRQPQQQTAVWYFRLLGAQYHRVSTAACCYCCPWLYGCTTGGRRGGRPAASVNRPPRGQRWNIIPGMEAGRRTWFSTSGSEHISLPVHDQSQV
ncbi:unnamed protein product, partial [Pylaiella littoralis]